MGQRIVSCESYCESVISDVIARWVKLGKPEDMDPELVKLTVV